MKCTKCGKEFTSDKVFLIHTRSCKGIKEEVIIRMDNPNMYKEMSYNELREQTKVEGIEGGKNPKKDDLIKALEVNRFGEEQPEV